MAEILADIGSGVASGALWDAAKHTAVLVGSILCKVDGLSPPSQVRDSYCGLWELERFIDISGIKTGHLRGGYQRHPETLRMLLEEINTVCLELLILRRRLDPEADDNDPEPPKLSGADIVDQPSTTIMDSTVLRGSLVTSVAKSLKEFEASTRDWLSSAEKSSAWRFVWSNLADAPQEVEKRQIKLNMLLRKLVDTAPSQDVDLLRSTSIATECAELPQILDLFGQVESSINILSSHRRLSTLNKARAETQEAVKVDGSVVEKELMYLSYKLIKERCPPTPETSHWITEVEGLPGKYVVEKCSVTDPERSWRRLGLLCAQNQLPIFPGTPVLKLIHRAREDRNFGDDIYLIFELPSPRGVPSSGTTPRVHELRSLIGTMSPSLDKRLQLAKAVMRFVFSYHALGWVHKHLSSQNVIFLSYNHDQDTELRELAHPYVVGLDYARQFQGAHAVEYSEKRTYREWEQLYRHPDYTSRASFSPRYDLYAAGILLWEIGVWNDTAVEALSQWFTYSPANQVRALRKLEFATGKGFASVVQGCMHGRFKPLGSDREYDLQAPDMNLLQFEARLCEEMERLCKGFEE